MDNQFCNDASEDAIKPAILISHAAREYIFAAERCNCTVKEHMQSFLAGYHTSQYQI